MTKYIDVTGKTEDEAIENALRELGLERDEISVEILERARSGFLGIGGSPAIIRAFYETEDEIAEETKPVHREAKTENPAPKAAPVLKKASGEKQKSVEKFLDGLFEQMGTKVDLSFTEGEDGAINVELYGDDMGTLIGRRGETLDAIQHLANYAVNRGESGRVKINIDAENYRQKRAESLERLAEKVAGKVVKYRRNITLEPMNAYERHVIHTALQDFSGVTTFSTGNEPNRRVVVAFERGGKGDSSDRQRQQRASSGKGSAAGKSRRTEQVERKENKASEPVQAPVIESKYPSREWN